MNILLTFILLTNLAIFACLILFFVKSRSIIRQIRDFITPADDKTPSPLAQTTSAISEVFARSFVAQAKATFMGIQSGQVRADKAIEADVAMDALQMTNPMIASILQMFPSIKKAIRKNPAIIDMAFKQIGKINAPAGDNHDNDHQGPLNLNIGV